MINFVITSKRTKVHYAKYRTHTEYKINGKKVADYFVGSDYVGTPTSTTRNTRKTIRKTVWNFENLISLFGNEQNVRYWFSDVRPNVNDGYTGSTLTKRKIKELIEHI